MPFKSEAQRKYMFAAAGRGEIPKSTVKEFARATKEQGKKLPERVSPKAIERRKNRQK